MRIVILALLFTLSLPALAQPEKEVKKQIDSLIIFIKNKATESFATQTVYKGDDIKKKWKDANNPAHPEELKAAKEMMKQLEKALSDCNYKEFDTFKQHTESEGTWYVYTYACGASMKIHLAFLKIKGKYLLGDIDVESEDDDDD